MSFSDIAGTDTFMPGSEMPLLLETGPPSVTEQMHVVALDLGDHQADLAVVDQQPVAGPGVVGQTLVGGGDPVVVPTMSSTVMATCSPVVPVVRAVGEPAQPDLRTLQVGEDADRAARTLAAACRMLLNTCGGRRGRRG